MKGSHLYCQKSKILINVKLKGLISSSIFQSSNKIMQLTGHSLRLPRVGDFVATDDITHSSAIRNSEGFKILKNIIWLS